MKTPLHSLLNSPVIPLPIWEGFITEINWLTKIFIYRRLSDIDAFLNTITDEQLRAVYSETIANIQSSKDSEVVGLFCHVDHGVCMVIEEENEFAKVITVAPHETHVVLKKDLVPMTVEELCQKLDLPLPEAK